MAAPIVYTGNHTIPAHLSFKGGERVGVQVPAQYFHISVAIDMAALIRVLGDKAARNKSRRSKALAGIIKVVARES